MHKLKEKGYFIISVALIVLFSLSVILFFTTNSMAVKKSKDMEIINNLNWLIPLGKYEYLTSFEARHDLLIFKENNHYGIVNDRDEIIVPAIYNYISPYGKSDYILCDIQGKSGYLDLSGNIVIPFIYDIAYDFCGQYTLVKHDSKYKVIDKTGDTIYSNPQNYQMYPTEKEGFFTFWQEGDFDDSFKGLINIITDKVVIKAETYKGAFQYAEGFWLTETEPHTSLRIPVFLSDENFKEVFTDKTLHLAMPFREGLAAVTTFAKNVDPVNALNLEIAESGYINYEGKILINHEDLNTSSFFKEGIASAYNHKGLYYINTSGNIIFEIPRKGNFLYSKESFQEGFACVKVDNRWGYIDKKGDFLIPPMFHDAFPVTGNVALVIYSGKYGAFNIKNHSR